MANYQEERVKLTKYEVKQIKISSKKGILRLNKKNFEDEEFPHELFLKTRQTAKVRNVFANNMSTDINLVKFKLE